MPRAGSFESQCGSSRKSSGSAGFLRKAVGTRGASCVNVVAGVLGLDAIRFGTYTPGPVPGKGLEALRGSGGARHFFV